MPLSREFKTLVVARAEKDAQFRRGLITEALSMILRGEITAGRLMIRDYINATGSMNDIAAKLGKQKPAIVRMLGPSGNPTLESFIPVVKACAEREQIERYIRELRLDQVIAPSRSRLPDGTCLIEGSHRYGTRRRSASGTNPDHPSILTHACCLWLFRIASHSTISRCPSANVGNVGGAEKSPASMYP